LFVLLREIWSGTGTADVGFHRAKYAHITRLDLINGVRQQKWNKAFIFETMNALRASSVTSAR
jgi:hypothetical protein